MHDDRGQNRSLELKNHMIRDEEVCLIGQILALHGFVKKQGNGMSFTRYEYGGLPLPLRLIRDFLTLSRHSLLLYHRHSFNGRQLLALRQY